MILKTNPKQVRRRSEVCMENEIVKINVKHRYPWDSLKEVGDSFIIPAENKGGKYHRQLVFAANQSRKRKGINVAFKSYTLDNGDIEIRRIL